jgi:hypothetical protein
MPIATQSEGLIVWTEPNALCDRKPSINSMARWLQYSESIWDPHQQRSCSWDLTLRRQFRLHEHLLLQARGDFFNILNHPDFGNPISYLNSPQFGEATRTLNNSLGGGGQSGGLSPLYQTGGPRSTQLALRLLPASRGETVLESPSCRRL